MNRSQSTVQWWRFCMVSQVPTDRSLRFCVSTVVCKASGGSDDEDVEVLDPDEAALEAKTSFACSNTAHVNAALYAGKCVCFTFKQCHTLICRVVARHKPYEAAYGGQGPAWKRVLQQIQADCGLRTEPAARTVQKAIKAYIDTWSQTNNPDLMRPVISSGGGAGAPDVATVIDAAIISVRDQITAYNAKKATYVLLCMKNAWSHALVCRSESVKKGKKQEAAAKEETQLCGLAARSFALASLNERSAVLKEPLQPVKLDPTLPDGAVGANPAVEVSDPSSDTSGSKSSKRAKFEDSFLM